MAKNEQDASIEKADWMSHHLVFNADQTFLKFSKECIRSFDDNDKNNREKAAAVIIACASALEAKINSYLMSINRLPAWDELKIKSKIETLYFWGNRDPDWGSSPLQEINTLIRIRNWLLHFKEPVIGLSNTGGEWIVDSHNKKPKIDPKQILTKEFSSTCYLTTIAALVEIGKLSMRPDYEFDYLISEDYSVFELH